MALLLGFPANETVIPLIIMGYTANGVMTDFAGYGELAALLTQNGWTAATAVCMIIITVLHFPCSTTLPDRQKGDRQSQMDAAFHGDPDRLRRGLLCGHVACDAVISIIEKTASTMPAVLS